MKLKSSLSTIPAPPSPFTLANLFGGTLTNKRRIYLSVYCLLMAAIWNTHSISAAPAKLDSLDATFPLDLQPPIFEASAASQTQGENDATATTRDSYGNPIESLQPIETPDGRKVVSAQGLQFEIPNYASGITEIKKPADDLLPPFVDKFGSDTKHAEVTTTQTKANNPFLPSYSFDDGKYRPQNYGGRQNTATTTRRPTTTTTTTTTTTPATVEKNPFEPTIPPYLLDFDYPDLGPGVPFVYDPNEDENAVDKNILPPSQTVEDSDRPASASNPSSSNSPFSNSQPPQGFTNKFTTSTISLASSSSIPSIVTAPLPSTQTNQDQDVLSTATQPPVVFVPPSPTAAEGITTTFNKNFAASFEPASTSTAASSSSTTVAVEKKVTPLSADRESFPPFNNIITGSTTLPSKTTFSKSEDGKVITNNVFLTGGSLASSTSVKPVTSSYSGNSQEKNTFTSNTQSLTKTTTSAATSGNDASSTFGSKYTGRFGGPPGILAPQSNNAFTTASSTLVTKSYNKPPTTSIGSATTGSSSANHKFTGSFGGPPGILKPYDNVKSG